MDDPDFPPEAIAERAARCRPDESFDEWLDHHCYSCGRLLTVPGPEGDHRWCFEKKPDEAPVA